MTKLWLQYRLLYYVSTLVQFLHSFGDLNHVTVCIIRLLCYFSCSCDQHSTAKGHSPSQLRLQSSADPHRESLLPEKQRSVYSVVTFPTHRTILEREKKSANKHRLFPPKQDSACCCALGCDVIVMVHPICDLWADDSQIA